MGEVDKSRCEEEMVPVRCSRCGLPESYHCPTCGLKFSTNHQCRPDAPEVE
jgi:hypothetical protein